MKKFLDFKFIFFILIVSSLLRFWQLGTIPVSMSDDELRETFSAYSIWHTGKDLIGRQFPLSINLDSYSFNPVSIYITSPIVGLFGLSMVTARISYAIMGVLGVIFTYLLLSRLLNHKLIAFLSAFALSVSVWHIQVSRFSHQGVYALTFYTIAVYYFLLVKKNNFSFLLLSCFFFFVAFHSYNATKIIFIPVLISLIWYKWAELSKTMLLFIGGFCLLCIISFAIISKTQDAAQYGTGQFFFQDTAKASQSVELERRASPSPKVLQQLYHNKLTYWSGIFINQYLYAFSPQYLFLYQEASGIYSLWFRGQLYLIELPLLLMGIVYLFKTKKKEFFLVSLFLLISVIPSGVGVNTPSYTMRSIFMLPWLMLFVGTGIFAFSHVYKNKFFKIGISLVIVIFYTYSIGGYLTQYYYEWPLYGSLSYSKASRDVVEYIIQEKTKKSSIFVTNVTPNILLHYAFYNKISPEVVQKHFKTNPIKIDNITFQLDCFPVNDPRLVLQKNTLYITKPECHKYAKEDFKILSPDKKEVEWKIYSR